MAIKQYIGARYVPIILGPWSDSRAYEPLSVVTYNYMSYTSKKKVPAGIVPTNEEYWALTGNYTGFIGQIDEKLQAEEQARRQADAAIIDQLNATVAQERSERTAADTALTAKIDSDVTAENAARTAADAALTTKINDDVAAERAARIQADETLNARMDEFTQLPAGSVSTAADAELVDIRVGADGVTYASAGAAVRANDNLLKASLNRTNITHLNIIDPSKYQYNKVYRTTVGTTTITTDLNTVTSGNSAFGIYPCNNGDRIYFSGRNQASVWLFDTSGVLRLYEGGHQDEVVCSVSGYTIGYWAIVDNAANGSITAWKVPAGFSSLRTLVQEIATSNGVYQANELTDALIGKTAIRTSISNVLQSNYSTVLPDLNEANTNTIYAINNALSNIANHPEGAANSGTLINLNGSYSNIGGSNHSFTLQFYVDINNTIYYRSCWGNNWTSWISLGDDLHTNYANFSAIPKFGVIGDSLSVGARSNRQGQTVTDINGSWAKYISDKCNNDFQIFGFGGATTTSWINNPAGLTAALDSENECDAYIVGLGYNDANAGSSSGGVTLGSMADIDPNDPDNNGLSYYGNLDKILRKMHAAYPNAPLFVLTNPYYNVSAVPQYNTAVRDVCERLGVNNNVFLIDMYALYAPVYMKLAADREGNHYHKQGYFYMGSLIATAISDYMLNNISYFKYVGD